VSRPATLLLLCFAAGLTLTSATQLRIPGMPLGPGEALLAGWLAATVLGLAWSRTVRRGPMLTLMGGFWAVGFVALLAGFLPVSPRVYEPTSWSIVHDLTSFVFTASIIVGFAAAGAEFERVRRAALLVLTLTVVPLCTLYLLAFSMPSLGPFDLWYGSRFVGWAANPNQLALAVLAAPFVALRLAAAQRGGARAWAVCLAVGSVVVGVASRSDALLASWAAGAGVMAVLAWARLGLRGVHSIGAAAVAYLLLPLLIVGGVLSFGPELARGAEALVSEAYDDGGQGADRLRLWRHGVDAIRAAPVFGLGPGSHSGDTGADGTSEAHNTLIDWGASTGLVGIAAYLAVLGWAVLAAWRRGRISLLSAVVAMVCFGMFHYVLRQPVYWFYIVAVAVLSGDAGTRESKPVLARRGALRAA
jgi:O-antigen ligase